MPAGQFTSAAPSAADGMAQAAYTIAHDSAGLVWAGGSLWRFPIATEIGAGLPYLVVETPEFDPSMSRMPPEISGEAALAWTIRVHGLFPYGDPTNPLTFTTPWNAMKKLVQAFLVNYTLNNTGVVKVTDAGIGPISVGQTEGKLDPATPFMSAYVTLTAYEYLLIDNTVTP